MSSQQVRFSESPVRLGQQARCNSEESTVSVRTDPETGDLMAIIIHCGCGEVTVVECNYGNHVAEQHSAPDVTVSAELQS